MAVGSEIVTKISSIKSTRKVTTALEMVSASKIKKAQDQMQASRPYTSKIKQMIGHLAKATPGRYNTQEIAVPSDRRYFQAL